eukprot:CAMPEP_0178384040 /NCGR_PEP_ID=MMETSP0689_2-20121128/7310_1 /TAXON_ID=160604 /ORGANISM="Amphidinium massartii, Strain CS-259" /LENGTH=317 /DNA_ID=CAMNT_0020004275 /DNA_START=252 /DNA_END=1206 /DNA_ORIENTATION=+
MEPVNVYMGEMKATARDLAASERVLLDADDLSKIDYLEEDAELRRQWRDLVYMSSNCISACAGVVLSDEGLQQQSLASDRTFLQELTDRGVLVGTHVDMGYSPLNAYGEKGTTGDAGLDARCKDYYNAGVRFGVWRTQVLCTGEMPTDVAVWDNMFRMAQSAYTCQLHGLMPIVHIEISVEGGKQTTERTAYVLEKVLSQAMRQLNECDVNIEALILTTSFCLAGENAAPAPLPLQGELTARALTRSLPPALAGVRFIPHSSSQDTPEGLLSDLVMVKEALLADYWPLGLLHTNHFFSDVLSTWAGDENNVTAVAQD